MLSRSEAGRCWPWTSRTHSAAVRVRRRPQAASARCRERADLVDENDLDRFSSAARGSAMSRPSLAMAARRRPHDAWSKAAALRTPRPRRYRHRRTTAVPGRHGRAARRQGHTLPDERQSGRGGAVRASGATPSNAALLSMPGASASPMWRSAASPSPRSSASCARSGAAPRVPALDTCARNDDDARRAEALALRRAQLPHGLVACRATPRAGARQLANVA